jgi:phosphatidylglycerol:prolipoprotein diacylglycerol transferase
MRSVLFTIGPITIYSYGLMIAIGILCALFFSSRKFKKLGIDDEILYGLALVALIFGFLSSKLLYVIVEFREFLYDPWGTLSGSGFVLYGGIIGGVCAAMVYCRRKKLDFMKYFDLLIPYVAMAQGFGRIGCFLAGCCYGAETDCFLSVTFHNSPFAPNGCR